MTMTAARPRPVVRSAQQRLDALVRANKVRSQRAVLKRELAAGETTATKVLLAFEPWVATMKIEHLLVSLPKLGTTKVRRLLNQCRISTAKTVGGMSDRQRAELVAALDGR